MKWNHRIIASLLFLATLQMANGQTGISFNVHAGPQFAWLSSSAHDMIDPDGSILHMQAGIQMDYFFAENYAFIVGFGINNMGGNLSYAESVTYNPGENSVVVESGDRMKMNLQYLDIPVGLKLKTEEMGYITGFLQVGLNPMLNINAKLSTKDGASNYDKASIQESVNLFNLGYHVGIGAEYKLGGNTAATGGVRWTSGLINVTENDGASISVNAISIHLGIIF
ncbi:MAG: porin family protein [Bacteroidota bacterium]